MSDTSSSTVSSSTSSSGKTRVTGLMSTMDVDAMVKASMSYDQSRLDKVKQDITYDGWKQDAYRAINTLLQSFMSTYLDSTNDSSSLGSTNAMGAKTLTTSITTSSFSVTAGAGSQVDRLVVRSCQMATKKYMESAAITPSGSTAVPDMKISDMISQLDPAGTNITKTHEGDKDYVSFKINGKDFKIATDATMTSMMNAINNTSGIGAKMIYNSFNNKFQLTADTTGSDAQLSVTDSSGLLVGTKGLLGAGIISGGQNAKLVIDDGSVNGNVIVKQTNTFSIDGYNFQINGDYNAENNAANNVTISTQPDVDGIYNKIADFVQKYNTLVGGIGAELNEKKDHNYPPLTDAQKAKMKDSEITAWEVKAKQGIIRYDNSLTNLMSNVRSLIDTQTSTTGLSMADIGITTGKYENCPYGQLVIDTNKLKDAIKNNGPAVLDLFTKQVKYGTDEAKYNGGGLAYKMNSLMSNYIDQSTNITIANLTQSLTDLTAKQTRLNKLFSTKEDQLYSRYSKLEVELSKMSSQASSLSN